MERESAREVCVGVGVCMIDPPAAQAAEPEPPVVVEGGQGPVCFPKRRTLGERLGGGRRRVVLRVTRSAKRERDPTKMVWFPVAEKLPLAGELEVQFLGDTRTRVYVASPNVCTTVYGDRRCKCNYVKNLKRRRQAKCLGLERCPSSKSVRYRGVVVVRAHERVLQEEDTGQTAKRRRRFFRCR